MTEPNEVTLVIRARGRELYRGHPNDARARGQLYLALIAHGEVQAEILAARPGPATGDLTRARLEPPVELDAWRDRHGPARRPPVDDWARRSGEPVCRAEPEETS